MKQVRKIYIHTFVRILVRDESVIHEIDKIRVVSVTVLFLIQVSYAFSREETGKMNVRFVNLSTLLRRTISHDLGTTIRNSVMLLKELTSHVRYVILVPVFEREARVKFSL